MLSKGLFSCVLVFVVCWFFCSRGGRLYLLLFARLALGTHGPSFFIVFLIGKKNESQMNRDPRAKGVDTFDLPPEPLFLSSGLKRMLRLMVSTCTTEEGAGGEALRGTRSS